jgi:hypothetical protein
VNRSRIARFVSLIGAGALVLSALAVGPVSAANPGWQVTFKQLPAVVKAGNDAGWKVTFTNPGPSQINDQNIIIDSRSTTAPYTYLSDLDVSTGFAETCTTTGGVTTCNVGTMPAGGTVVFTVAFEVPEGYTDKNFYLDILVQAGTGDTGSDGPGKSRGDKKPFADFVTVSTNPNIDGGFVTEAAPEQIYQTVGSLGRQNKQNSTVEVNDTAIPVTVADGGIFLDPTCTNCGHLIGEWTYLDVPGSTNTIEITLMIWGGSVDGGVSADEIYLVHVKDNGSVELIGDDPINEPEEICDSATSPSEIPCILVTKIGANYKLIGFLDDNGSLRGSW